MNAPLAVLIRLILQQYAARLRRTGQRLRSAKRLLPTILVLISAALWLPYFLAATWMRPPADLQNLHRWLSGGLTLYAVFHLVRAAWQAPEVDLGMSPAQRLWLGCSPLPRWTLVLYKAIVVLVPTFVKATMLCVLLARDTPQPWLAAVAIIAALLSLELIRLLVFTFASGLSQRGTNWLRGLATSMALAIAAQVLTRASLRWHGTWDHTAPVRFVMNVFAALGETAADSSIQRLAILFQPFATLATSESVGGLQWASMLWAVTVIGGLMWLTLWAERAARLGQLNREHQRLTEFRSGRFASHPKETEACLVDTRRPHGARLRCLPFWGGIGPLASRQLVTLRRYRAIVFVSLAIPGVLSLLPIWLGGFGTGTVLDVIGGLTFYTLLLAPPALKMDFRRDIEIMLPLAAMPLRPLTMVIGQIAVPVVVTILFQVVVVLIALAVRPVSALQAVFWLTTLAGTAVFAFALENALFLAFPHRLKQEGIEMFVRTKLVFIGKGCLWAIATAVLVAWTLFCARTFDQPFRLPVLTSGILLFVWSLAGATLWIAARVWKRFDLSSDLPA